MLIYILNENLLKYYFSADSSTNACIAGLQFGIKLQKNHKTEFSVSEQFKIA